MTIFEKLYAPGRAFLGCDFPLICGAMTWVSDPKLVATVCNEGAFASLAGGNAPAEILDAQINETRTLTDHPFGVNVITVSPAYRSQLEVLKANPAPVVIFGGSVPREKEIQMMKEVGSKVMCFAPTQAVATRMMNFGADALILEGTEAGGHIGQVSLTVLLQQVLMEEPSVPVFVGGGLVKGEICAHLLLMGAAGIQMGTRFAVSHESCAHENFKNAYIRADARTAVPTPQFDERIPVIPVRALKNHGTADFGKLQLKLIRDLDDGAITREDAQLQLEHFWMGALRKAVMEGDVDNGSLMAGQSVGLIAKSESVHDIIQDVRTSLETEIKKVSRFFEA